MENDKISFNIKKRTAPHKSNELSSKHNRDVRSFTLTKCGYIRLTQYD